MNNILGSVLFVACGAPIMVHVDTLFVCLFVHDWC
jgi:hypothetical protein